MPANTQEFLEVTTTRHNELIDPFLTIWAWEIPVYLFLGGLAAGLLVLPALLEMLRGDKPLPKIISFMPFLGLGLLSVGMGTLFLDLEYKLHVYRFYLSFEWASPMSWGSWILLVVYPVGLALGFLLLTEADREKILNFRFIPQVVGPWLREVTSAYRKIILWMSVIAGSSLGIYTGLLLGTLGARPLWNTTLLGPLFLVSGLSTAAAFILLFKPQGETQHRITRWDVGLIVTELFLLGLVLLTLMTGGQAAQMAGSEFLGGSWTGAFWGLVVVLGLLVPLGMEILELTRSAKPAMITSILVLTGGLALRWILLVAGQVSNFSLTH